MRHADHLNSSESEGDNRFQRVQEEDTKEISHVRLFICCITCLCYGGCCCERFASVGPVCLNESVSGA